MRPHPRRRNFGPAARPVVMAVGAPTTELPQWPKGRRGRIPERYSRPETCDSTAPFAVGPVLSGSSCRWIQAERIMVRSAPNVKVASTDAA
jgi:hypothetical protein